MKRPGSISKVASIAPGNDPVSHHDDRMRDQREYDSSKSKVGRPRKRKGIRKLVVDMALVNLGWGYTKIRDALRIGWKIEIGRTTVANILLEEGIETAPDCEKKRTWKRFMMSHWDTLYAYDFFSVEALSAFCTVRYMVFFIIEVKTGTSVRRMTTQQMARSPVARASTASSISITG